MMPPVQQPNNPYPQKIVTDIQQKIMPSGSVVQLRHIEVVTMINNNLSKERIFEQEPPMADGTTAQDISAIQECAICLGLFHKDNVRLCQVCGQYCCPRCRMITVIPELDIAQEAMAIGYKRVSRSEIFHCIMCLEKMQMTLFQKIYRRFWNL